MCVFNAVVWTARTYHYSHFNLGHTPREAEVIHRLSQEALHNWVALTKPKIAKGLGSAGSRTAAQTAAAKAYAKRILDQMDPAGLVFYTDGSAKPNPGPCGAGVLYTRPRMIECELAIGIGMGTNNLGELWAIGAAIELADREVELDPTLRGCQAYIITDSQYAIGVLLDGWASKHDLNTAITDSIKRMIRRSSLHWHINWTPGHAGVPGNEVADAAANQGADISQEGGGITNLLQRAQSDHYLIN